MSFAMEEQFVLDAPRFVDLTNADEDLNNSTSADEYFFRKLLFKLVLMQILMNFGMLVY